MRNIILFLLLNIMVTGAIAQPTDADLLNRMSQGLMPGASFVVIKDGKWVYNRNLGLANIPNNKRTDSNTIYMMASVSKTMIATAVMQLWEKKMIDLDADVSRYLPFSLRTPSLPNDSITMRMLLTHTSAVKDDWNVLSSLYVVGDSPVSLDSFMRNYCIPGGIYYSASNFYTYKPGSQYNYSNAGSTIAAYVVEHLTGDDFYHYCDTAIFKKLCMSSSSFLLKGIADTTRIARPYTYDDNNYEDVFLYGYPDYPDGQLRTSVTDMARFMTMYLQHGQYEGTRILDSTTVTYMLRQQTPVRWSQGLIFYAGVISGDTVWGHNGGDGGVNTGMYFNLKKKTGAIAFTNGEGTNTSSADKFCAILYNYGLTVTPGVNDVFPQCNPTMSVSNALTSAADISIYPNPTQGTLNIDMPFEGNAAIYDMQGRIQHSSKVAANVNAIQLPASMPGGMYIIKLTGNDSREAAIKRFTLVR